MTAKKVLVVGDTILDVYAYVEVNRVSPEAPCLVADYKAEEHILGGACNVAANIRSLSRDLELQIDYYGYYSYEIKELLQSYDIKCIGIPMDPLNILTKKRFICNKNQILRVDNHRKYSDDNMHAVNSLIFRNLDLSEYDIVVVSDYDKNTVTETEFDILAQNKNVPKIIDLKRVRPEMMSFGENQCILKCNEKEFDDNPHITLLGSKVIVTTGEKGYWFPQTDERFPKVRNDGEVVDVVGAGDCFTAALGVNFLETKQFDCRQMCEFANIVAGCSVKKFGTYVVKRSEI